MNTYLYRLRQKGVRLSVEAVLSLPPLEGWLTYNRPHVLGMPGTHAQFLDGETHRVDLAPQLMHAKVGRIEGGMLISGVETVVGGRPSQIPQTWAIADTPMAVAGLVQSLRRKQDIIAAIWAERQST